jgi:hypothetical protein
VGLVAVTWLICLRFTVCCYVHTVVVDCGSLVGWFPVYVGSVGSVGWLVWLVYVCLLRTLLVGCWLEFFTGWFGLFARLVHVYTQFATFGWLVG